MWVTRPKLVEPSLKYGPSLCSMVREYLSAGERRYFDVPSLRDNEVPSYLAYLTLRAESYDLKPSHVRQYTYWLVRGEKILGASRLRPTLTPQMYEWGGHITYDIRPSQRGKGYGTLILELTLEQAREFGLPRVRLMCYENNAASAKVIENNGGQLVYSGPCALAGGAILTYDIELAPSENKARRLQSSGLAAHV